MMNTLRTFSGPLHEKSYRYALRVTLFCRSVIEQKKEFVLSKQLMKSATSVGANIEEAQQPQSRADFISKLSIALKEGYESRYWLHLMRDAGYATESECSPLVRHSEEIINMLVRSIRTAKIQRL